MYIQIKIKNLRIEVRNLNDRISKQNQLLRRMQENSINQNNVIVELLSEIKAIVKSQIPQKLEYLDVFPISSQDELESIEEDINENTIEAMVAAINHIKGKADLSKCIRHIIDLPLLLEYNVYGLQAKKRLLNYPKFMKVLYQAVGTDCGNKAEFYKHFSKCIRLVKNVHYKNESARRSRKKLADE
uniref:DUF4806 domain-containing protein n=1 Tax=Stomoxys calcitrans TaxID=35570 RepID=A0A1I8PNA4_STOCA